MSLTPRYDIAHCKKLESNLTQILKYNNQPRAKPSLNLAFHSVAWVKFKIVKCSFF